CDQVVGKKCFDVFRSNICEKGCLLRKAIDTGQSFPPVKIYIINKRGQRIPVSITATALRDKNGQVLGGVETFRDLSSEDDLRKFIRKNYTYHDIVSKNKQMWQLFELLPQIAESNSTVLLEGESGTGKELIARVIHQLSPRAEKNFVAINSGGLPDNLLESELFGYKAGAFTDARRDKIGRIALAQDGTLFLDEIGDVSPAFQVKLLRFLQEKTYEPLGSVETLKANVRIIAATNKNLEELVAAGIFRKDLYYRIKVIRLYIPPLRQRKEDIPLLVEHFINRFNHLQGKQIEGVSQEVLQILMHYSFPGNVRELENIIEHAFVLCNDAIIQGKHLPLDLFEQRREEAQQKYQQKLQDMEAELILRTLKEHNWNRQAAARALNMHKTTLFRKIKRLGIELPPVDGRRRH
ncbi:MAG: sigma 54-interacting transcriptional regulator, partial [Caldisericaceae bacterium]|nr:sigma 54-interacting transcriptional regulator [Caldisericaceae bacterium]